MTRDFKASLKWLSDHNNTATLGFNPDGQCLKITRLARGIGPKYPSAKKAQDATPQEDRVYKVKDLRQGMVLYYDDPNDSNRFGHIVTMIGRVKGYEPSSLHDILVVTNSVQRGRLTVVRGDYFPVHWGDKFQFGATSLNGVDLDFRSSKGPVAQFSSEDGPRYHVGLLDAAANRGRQEARKIRDDIDHQVRRLPKDDTVTRVFQFKQEYAKTRTLRMGLLHKAVTEGGRDGIVKDVYDRIMQLVEDLPSY